MFLLPGIYRCPLQIPMRPHFRLTSKNELRIRIDQMFFARKLIPIKKRLILFVLVMITNAGVVADSPHPVDAVLGLWMIYTQDAVIQIRRDGDEFTGDIVWLKDKFYKAEDGAERAGRPLLDDRNPDAALRKRPLIGLPMLRGLRYDGHGRWIDGRVYNSNDGGTYSVQLELGDVDHLKLRGYIGISLFGSTSIWTRVSEPPKP